ncbi:MAG: methyl-accepting chemotaxis protein [Desulfuromonadaceae bacterium]|nr:methyl-accepting chemotaxis protein [Desulfuromonadaceae bacterium]
MKNMSLKVKIIAVGVLLPALLLGVLFGAYVVQTKNKTVHTFVEKARSITLTVESTRQGLEELYEMGVLSPAMLRSFADAGQIEQVVRSVPVVSAWHSAMRKAKEGNYEFRVPKFEPRTASNTPDVVEARALNIMKSEGLKEYYEIDKKLNAVRYFRPVILTETCMLCHGDPRTSERLWGNSKGLDPTGVKMENWRVGELHGAFEVIQALDQADAELTAILWKSSAAVLTGLIICGAMIASFMLKRVTRPLEENVAMIEALAQGDLGKRIQYTSNDEAGRMAAAMNAFADNLQFEIITAFEKLAAGNFTFEAKGLIREPLAKANRALNESMGHVRLSADQIASGSDQVSDTSQSLSQAATQQASSLEEINSSMNEMASRTRQNGENAIQANSLSADACKAAEHGNTQMQEMVGAMAEINESAQNISRIIKVIDEIAFQTNLLALNAAVEAARAGQHGKGFAVVAEEVRNLAARSAKAASETTAMIESAIQKAENGTQIAEGTAEALDGIVSGITKVSDLVGEIAAASDEQTKGISQISIGLEQIDEVTQQNTANAVQCAATSEELAAQAHELREMLSRFMLSPSYGGGHGNRGGQGDSAQRRKAIERSAKTTIERVQKKPVQKRLPQADKDSWGASKGSSSAADFIALDDDEFGRF